MKDRSKKTLRELAGGKPNYEVSLVQQIIQGRLSGHEFCDKVRPKGQLQAVQCNETDTGFNEVKEDK